VIRDLHDTIRTYASHHKQVGADLPTKGGNLFSQLGNQPGNSDLSPLFSTALGRQSKQASKQAGNASRPEAPAPAPSLGFGGAVGTCGCVAHTHAAASIEKEQIEVVEVFLFERERETKHAMEWNGKHLRLSICLTAHRHPFHAAQGPPAFCGMRESEIRVIMDESQAEKSPRARALEFSSRIIMAYGRSPTNVGVGMTGPIALTECSFPVSGSGQSVRPLHQSGYRDAGGGAVSLSLSW
jgi:hypothetical protein